MRSVLASRNQELYTFTARDVSDIADRLEDLLRDGPPAAPVRVAGVVLP